MSLQKLTRTMKFTTEMETDELVETSMIVAMVLKWLDENGRKEEMKLLNQVVGRHTGVIELKGTDTTMMFFSQRKTDHGTSEEFSEIVRRIRKMYEINPFFFITAIPLSKEEMGSSTAFMSPIYENMDGTSTVGTREGRSASRSAATLSSIE